MIRNDAGDYSLGFWLFLCLQNISLYSTRSANRRKNLFKLSFSCCGVLNLMVPIDPWEFSDYLDAVCLLIHCFLSILKVIDLYCPFVWPWMVQAINLFHVGEICCSSYPALVGILSAGCVFFPFSSPSLKQQLLEIHLSYCRETSWLKWTIFTVFPRGFIKVSPGCAD